MATPGTLRRQPSARPVLGRQAEHYAALLQRAYEARDRVKLTRCASEYPGFEHPLEVRQLAANVRAVAQRLVELLDGSAPPVEVSCTGGGEIVVVRG